MNFMYFKTFGLYQLGPTNFLNFHDSGRKAQLLQSLKILLQFLVNLSV